MDPSRRLWPRSDLRVGDADRQAVVSELQRHYVEGRLSSEELSERVTHALASRTFGDLATLLSDLPELQHPTSLATATEPDPDEWHTATSGFSPTLGLLLLLIGVVALVTVFMLPLGGHAFFLPTALIWGFFFIGRPYRRRRF